MLTPVSFKKGRQAQPRLSAPYVPGRRHERFWTDAEKKVLLDHYEKKGPAFCLTKLPGRSLRTIYQTARGLKLKAPGSGTKADPISDAYDDRIKAAWPLLKGRGAVTELADKLGIKRHQLSDRAIKLGLTLPHKKEPPWTPAEDALLRKAPVNNPDRASAFFKAHGFHRTATAISVRCKRQAVSRRRSDVLSARKAADILGIDAKTVAVFITDGVLCGERRGTKRLPQQGGDVWTINPADMRAFIIEHLDRIDIRKVDKFAFVDLLVHGGKAK